MIFPSFAVALTLVTGALASTSSNRVKRQNSSASAAASAALTLNSAVAYTICVISQGTFQAAAALGSKAKFVKCDTINPFASAKLLTTTLSVSGCPHYVPTLGRRSVGVTVGGNTCTPQSVNSNGQLQSIGSSSTPQTYTIPTSNGLCSGITQPFTLLAVGTPATAFTVANSYNVNCATGIITLAPAASTHFCVNVDAIYISSLVAQVASNTCSTTYVLTLNALAPSSR